MMANQAMILAGTSNVVSKYEDMTSCTLETVTPSMDSGRKHLEMVLNATGKNLQLTMRGLRKGGEGAPSAARALCEPFEAIIP